MAKRRPRLGGGLSNATTVVLRALQKDAKGPRKVLAHEIEMTEATLSKCVKLAEHDGIITSIVAVLDRVKLGFHAVCFFTIQCKDYQATERVSAMLVNDPNVQEIHRLDGNHPLLVKVVARTPDELSHWQDKMAGWGDVASIRGMMVMKTIQESLALPI